MNHRTLFLLLAGWTGMLGMSVCLEGCMLDRSVPAWQGTVDAAGGSAGSSLTPVGGAAGFVQGGSAGASLDASISDATAADVDVVGDSALDVDANPCADGQNCVHVPDGWSFGYAALDTATACTAGFSNDGEVLHPNELFYSDAQCSCSCGSLPAAAACSAIAIEIYDTVPDCTQGSNASFITVGGCTQLDTTSSLVLKTDVQAQGQCSGQVNESTQEPVWSKNVRLCVSDANVPPCDGTGACFTAIPPGRTACVWKKNGTDCPDGSPFTHAYELFSAYNDTRKCGPCQCRVIPGQVCGSRVLGFADSQCLYPQYMVDFSPSQCNVYTLHGAPDTVYVQLQLQGGGAYTCSPTSTPQPSGNVTADPDSKVLVCCSEAVPGL